MVQIGSFHIGSADTAKSPTISLGEAYCLWDNLLARYDFMMTVQVFHNYAYDPKFKKLLKVDIMDSMEDQIKLLEKHMNTYGIALPERSPKSVRVENISGSVKDEFIFRQVFTYVQDFLNVCAVSIKVMVVDDELRSLFAKLLLEKIKLFEKLCKFGLEKGWLETPPQMNN